MCEKQNQKMHQVCRCKLRPISFGLCSVRILAASEQQSTLFSSARSRGEGVGMYRMKVKRGRGGGEGVGVCATQH